MGSRSRGGYKLHENYIAAQREKHAQQFPIPPRVMIVHARKRPKAKHRKSKPVV